MQTRLAIGRALAALTQLTSINLCGNNLIGELPSFLALSATIAYVFPSVHTRMAVRCLLYSLATHM